MKIKQILEQHRRDFIALYECEHCGKIYQSDGYDDENFHKNVIPKIKCRYCDKKADENYRPLTTKYKEWEQV